MAAVFFGGAHCGPSSEYVTQLLDNLGVDRAYTYYSINRPTKSWFKYTPTYLEASTIPEIIGKNGYNWECRDEYTFNVKPTTVTNLIDEFEIPEDVKYVIGASQGGVLACELAIRLAETGHSVILILLSSSPR